MFIDRVVVHVSGGAGGSGCSSFRREHRVPFGGPDGGDGGRGGTVRVRGDQHLATLLDYTYRDTWAADRGDHGMGANMTGRSAHDLVLPVPPGTIVRDKDTGVVIAEVLKHGDEFVIAKGGRGGRGNSFFATATHQAPREWQPGEEGEARTLELELKLIADIGLVGEPNAGKSTLLSVVSKARPKIADYPFTTLSPGLGVVQLSDHRTFVVADIPGLIEGAHLGKGLGIQFLRHIERTRLLAFLIPIDALDWQVSYDKLRYEIQCHSVELAQKPHCVVFTKMDLLGDDELPPIEAPDAFGIYGISAVAGLGVDALLAAWWGELRALAARQTHEVADGIPLPDVTGPREALALACAPGVGAVTYRAAVERFGSASAAFDATLTPRVRDEALRAAEAIERDARRVGARILLPDSPEYPAALLDLRDPPVPLFARGDIDALSRPCVAIVGTRAATTYGERVTRAIATALANAGACVVSGMARGIDAAAHRAVLACGGRTAGVLGTGVDVPYPVAHRELHHAVAHQGVLLSEFVPGSRAASGSFPRRNRIIAALSTMTIVVEAGARSGAMITAAHALELGRTVAAVPGPIDAAESVGANELLRDGAAVIATPEDALVLMGLTAPHEARPASIETLSDGARRVLEALGQGAADVETIAVRARLPARECLAAVTALELAGRVECTLLGEVRRR